MNRINILYIGEDGASSTSRHRADAAMRLGHVVAIKNPYAAFRKQISHPLLGRLHYRTGYRFLQKSVNRWIIELLYECDTIKPDLVWVDGGELLGPGAVQLLKQLGVPIVLYNIDDPTGKRDGRRFDSLLAAIPAYDLCVVVREISADEFRLRGAKAVLQTWRSYDEVAHRPFDSVDEIEPRFRSDVVFIGTWIRGEGRDVFLLELIDAGLNVAIWGDRWNKAPSWNRLKSYWRGGSLAGSDYVSAIQGSKITLGLLSKGNRDLHTTRSVEIPYARGLLCAERTSEHLELYEDGYEAVFWSDPSACVEACNRLLADSQLESRIREAGARKIRELRLGNEDVARRIIERIFAGNASAAAHSKR